MAIEIGQNSSIYSPLVSHSPETTSRPLADHFKTHLWTTTFQIPFIQNALNLTGGGLKLYASPWSSPAWMKTSGKMRGDGQLKGEFGGKFYEAYARYFER